MVQFYLGGLICIEFNESDTSNCDFCKYNATKLYRNLTDFKK